MTLIRLTLIALATTLIILLPTAALAGGNKADKPFHGSVTAIDAKANTITITKKKTGAATTFDATNAVVTLNGIAAKLADITVGMYAEVTVGATPGTAATIDASTEKKHHKSAVVAPAPATPATATPASTTMTH